MPPADRDRLRQRLHEVRAHTPALAATLSAEDQGVQSMPDASPTKWHLAHTSWFFEAVVLRPHAPGYRVVDARYLELFNSYYESLGPRHPRPQRGLLTRPALADVMAYRAAIERALDAFVDGADADAWAAAAPLIELGLQHEQQHQELLLTDILHAFSLNPLQPAVRAGEAPADAAAAGPLGWIEHPGGEVEVGHAGVGFAFDNETPRHRVRLEPCALADRLVSNAEFQAFIADGGYRRPELWLSDGWAMAQAQGWAAPPYWGVDAGGEPRTEFGLHGRQPWCAEAPLAHVSFFEAAAYAAWAGARLPTEFEWEALAGLAGTRGQGRGWFGSRWQWTRSSYDPYPRFRPLAGAVGEYNGKFMVGQLVLRGSSVATPPGHARPSYRNFFPPAARWQFSGIRLAADR
jgi:ergothioneine biosynthesis protein EgtB